MFKGLNVEGHFLRSHREGKEPSNTNQKKVGQKIENKNH